MILFSSWSITKSKFVPGLTTVSKYLETFGGTPFCLINTTVYFCSFIILAKCFSNEIAGTPAIIGFSFEFSKIALFFLVNCIFKSSAISFAFPICSSSLFTSYTSKKVPISIRTTVFFPYFFSNIF